MPALRRTLILIVPCVLLLALLLVNFIGCKGKGQTRDTQNHATVELTEAAAPVARDELVGSDGRIKLRILCTTSPTEGRTADFTSFLSRHFIKVETADYESFREEQAKDFDVVIIDYGATRPGTPVPQLAPSYSRATITFGVAGSMVCRRLSLKPGYL